MTDELLPAPAFDPGSISLDLSTDHKIRVTALMLATRYYDGTIVKDGEMYQAMRMAGKNFRPAHHDHVIEAAQSFEHYIKTGRLRIEGDGEKQTVIIDSAPDGTEGDEA